MTLRLPIVPTCLYGLIATPDVARLPTLQGLDGSQVRAVVEGDIAALVSDVERAPDRTRLDDVRAHDTVLSGVVNAGITAVASRFGQTFRTDSGVRDAVKEIADRITALLRDCRGCVEMRVLLTPSLAKAFAADATDEPKATSPGTAYLHGARAALRGPRISLLPIVAEMVKAERAESLPNDRGAVVAHLLEGARVEEYLRALRGHSALTAATVVGPLALYTFAGVGDV